MEACFWDVCVAERAPYCEMRGLGFVDFGGLCEVFVSLGGFGLEGDVEEVKPPMMLISSAPLALSGFSSGPDPSSSSSSSSKMVFRFAGGGRLPNEGAFLVMLRP